MSLPNKDKIAFGSTAVRTTKSIVLRCVSPETRVSEQDMGGFVNEFEERVVIQVAVRTSTAEGERLGREPASLTAIEKYLVDLIKTNRGALHGDGVQYLDVVSVETFPMLEGGEENQQAWYHCNITCKLCYWMRITEPM